MIDSITTSKARPLFQAGIVVVGLLLLAGCGRSTDEKVDRAVNDLRAGRVASAGRQTVGHLESRRPRHAQAVPVNKNVQRNLRGLNWMI